MVVKSLSDLPGSYVMAVAKALEAKSPGLICASTGNTSASAAAYGARSGLGVPKTAHFCQKRTGLKSFTGREVWIGVPKTVYFDNLSSSGDSRPCSAECNLVKQ